MEKKVEFKAKNSIIERIDCDNFKQHYIHHLKTFNAEIENLITGTKTIAIDNNEFLHNNIEEIKVIKEESSLTVFLKT